MREIGHGDELSGLLSVRHVVPLGPADGYLQTGDILVSIDGKLCNHFVELEAVLDDKAELLAKGEQPTVVLTVFRHRQFVEIEIEVEDLHTITPSSYLELGGSIIHPLSFQLARAYLHPVNSVFIADPGTVFGLAGVPAYSVVTALNNEPTPDLETFIKVLQQLPDSKRVPVRFYSLSKKGVENVRVVTIDKRSTRFRMATRDDSKGTWIYTPIPSLPLDSASATAAAPARFIPLPTSSRGSTYGRVASKLQRSFCTVEWTSPFGMDGLTTKWSDGCGIVVDSVNGIVLVDRATIPTAMGRVSLTFANNLTVPGRILWICPIQNFGFLQYDPESVRGKIRPEPAGVEFSELGPMRPGDEVLLATINTTTHAIRVLETDIKSRGFFLYQDQHPPKYRTISEFQRGCVVFICIS